MKYIIIKILILFLSWTLSTYFIIKFHSIYIDDIGVPFLIISFFFFPFALTLTFLLDFLLRKIIHNKYYLITAIDSVFISQYFHLELFLIFQDYYSNRRYSFYINFCIFSSKISRQYFKATFRFIASPINSNIYRCMAIINIICKNAHKSSSRRSLTSSPHPT